MMSDKSREPEHWQASDLQSYPPQRTHRLRHRLGSSALDIYLKLLYPFAIVGNLAVIASVPLSAIAERGAHPLSALHRIARRDLEIAK
jgi:hypothetical protein